MGIVSKAVIKYSYEAGKPLSKVITMFSSRIGTSKHASWPTSTLTLLTWSNKLLPSYILHMKANKKDVGQIICLLNVAKDFPLFCGTFATLDVCKFVVCQIEANDGHGLLDTFLDLFNVLQFILEGEAFLDLSTQVTCSWIKYTFKQHKKNTYINQMYLQTPPTLWCSQAPIPQDPEDEIAQAYIYTKAYEQCLDWDSVMWAQECAHMSE